MTTSAPLPIGPREIGAILGVNRQRVLQIQRDHADFPPPWVELGTGRIWRDTDVAAWAESKGRTTHAVAAELLEVAPPWEPASAASE